jgi:nucleoside-diphosphate-sugar epimerase
MNQLLNKTVQKWADKNVIVTGGASFIGSHLVDKLVYVGANVTVVDNFSSGRIENLDKSRDKINLIKKDLEHVAKDEINQIFRDQSIVFHLAAVHGGRGYIQKHPADVCSNLSIDHHVFEGASQNNVENIVFASTACVYPDGLQSRVGSNYKLKESDSNPRKLDGYMSADIEYGWGKLMSEIQLNAFIKQYSVKGCPVRLVTAYGPRENETHAIIALISKAVQKLDPYPIWGDGKQERDFTYVEDIVNGMMAAAHNIFDGTPVNLGTGRRYKITEVVDTIFSIFRWRPRKLKFEKSMPVGPLSRALDIRRAKDLLDWEPKFSLEDGLRRTIKWYVGNDRMRRITNKEFLLEREWKSSENKN